MNESEQNAQLVDVTLIRWFELLPEDVRYRFSSQWMKDEAGGVSIAKLAEVLSGSKCSSEALVKSFRSFDLNKGRLKNVWRPDSGFSLNDVHCVCNAVNRIRANIGREDRASAQEFYLRAFDELGQQHTLEPSLIEALAVDQVISEPPAQLEPEPEIITPEPEITLPEKPQKNPLTMLIKGLGAAALVLLAVSVVWQVPEPISVAPEAKHYQQYLPGNVIQLSQLDDAGQSVTLSPPENYLSAGSCYPNLTPQSKASNIVSNNQLQALPLTPLDRKTALLPDLSIDDEVLRSSKVSFDGLNHWEITKGMINLGISDTCLASMQQVVDYGNNIEDYGIIKQSYVADVVRFDMVFSGNATKAQIAGLSDKIRAYFVGAEVDVVGGQNKRQITITGPVTVAYISQPKSARISM